MRLLIDIGNTRIKAALQVDGALQSLPPLAYEAGRLGEQLKAWALPPDLSSCWVASVGHADICAELAAWLLRATGIEAHFPGSTAAACGIRNAYDKPSNLGVDRWLAMIAAFDVSKCPIVVVSAGTAATIDAVDQDGNHLGGLIAPGIATQRKAMLQHTQVRANTEHAHLDELGKSTDACVTLGTLHTTLGYIERTVTRLRLRHADWRYFISGGDAALLLPHLQDDWQHEAGLVLKGLAILADAEN